MLRRVNKQEEESGKLSSLRHIIDMTGYEINPFTMIFVSSGTLSYYSQLFHYENYPELVYPIEMVNIAKWVHVPYRLIKTMMPAGFTDRFRLHDGNFMETLLEDLSIEHIPSTLGGKNADIKCIPAIKKPLSEYPKPASQHIGSLETIHLPPRKTKFLPIDVKTEGCKLSWYFSTDGDVYFGIFYEPQLEIIEKSKSEKEFETDSKEMVYPWWKLSAKLVHDIDSIECKKPGRYYAVFHNSHSWLQNRNVKVMVQLTDSDGNTFRHYQDGAREKISDDNSILRSLSS
uniref:CRAL-TRIO domain-containing protein n=1 Tax=Acrobeloides nanus TaxID=290746 RepID=A0A914E1E5_9BILA